MRYILDKDFYFKSSDFRLVDIKPKRHFQTKEIIGTNFFVVNINLDRFTITILKDIKNFKDIKKGSVVEFDELNANLYFIDGKPIHSNTAENITVTLEANLEEVFYDAK